MLLIGTYDRAPSPVLQNRDASQEPRPVRLVGSNRERLLVSVDRATVFPGPLEDLARGDQDRGARRVVMDLSGPLVGLARCERLQNKPDHAEELHMEDTVVEACKTNLIVWENYWNGISEGGDRLDAGTA